MMREGVCEVEGPKTVSSSWMRVERGAGLRERRWRA